MVRGLRALRRRASFSNVVSLTALFIVIGGVAWAANTVRTGDIVDGEVKTADLGASAVTTAKIKDNDVKYEDIGIQAVSSTRIWDESVRSVDVKDGALTGSDIAPNSIGSLDLADEFGEGINGGTFIPRFNDGGAYAAPGMFDIEADCGERAPEDPLYFKARLHNTMAEPMVWTVDRGATTASGEAVSDAATTAYSGSVVWKLLWYDEPTGIPTAEAFLHVTMVNLPERGCALVWGGTGRVL